LVSDNLIVNLKYNIMKKREINFRELVEISSDWIWEVNKEGVYTYSSPQVEALLGYKPEDIVGKKPYDIMPPKEAVRIEKLLNETIKNVEPIVTLENIVLHKDGRQIILETSGVPFFDKTGNIIGYRGVDRDITERKQVEEILRKSEEQFRLIAENIKDVITLQTFDMKAIYTYVSPSIKAISGYEPEELLGRSVFEFIHPDDKKNLFPLLKKYVNLKIKKILTGKQFPLNETIEFRSKDKFGNWFYVQSTGNIVGDQLLFVTRDITKRKQTEDLLMKSEKKYRDLFEKSEDAILIIHNGKFVDCNQATVNMLRYNNKSEFLNTHPSELSPEKQPDGKLSFAKANEIMKIALKNGSHRFEWDHKRNDGEVFPVEVLLTAISTDEKNQILHTVWRDITDRKQAEEELRESEGKYKRLVELNPEAIAIHSGGKIIYGNKAALDLLHIPNLKDFVGKPVLSFVHPDHIKIVSNRIMKGLDHGIYAKPIEEKFLCIDGEVIDVEVTAIPISYDEKPAMLVIGRNITESKKTKEALIFEQKQLLSMFDSVDEVIYVADSDTYELLYFNNAFKSRWKGKIGDKCYKVIQDRTSPCLFCSNKHIFGKNIGKTHIWEFRNKINQHWYRCIDKAIKWPDGRMVRYEMAIDINESKKAEEALKESEEKYRNLVESLVEGIASVDENENFTFVNQATCKIFGYSKIDLLQMNFKDILSPEDYKKMLKQTAKRKTGESGKYDLNIIMKNGDIRIITSSVSPIFKNGKFKGSFGIFHDITKRKKTEIELKYKMNELEIFNDAAVDREIIINESRKEINELLGKLGEEPKYDIVV